MGGAVQGPLVLRMTPPLNAHVLFLQVLGIKVETKVQCGALSLLCSLLCPALSTSGAWGWGLGAGNHPDPKPTSAGRTQWGSFPLGLFIFLGGGGGNGAVRSQELELEVSFPNWGWSVGLQIRFVRPERKKSVRPTW